ncbi:aminoacetone oxidase family FAD-binding enzyme [Halarcobacter ebronensis]|uniref:Aminoacetone oxidase family FAD-binding enzyme n=1 Tax=Halarcobacter ebronensis TaxID=1462615 RepID=A0A4Q0YHF7_9BACT|nr:NAD(P)/FAD-dependent oxidoreductase [Halarcobacter ebronensis]RXJ69735.1 aminoacetone oxidase family FAD-binding enzyme [Halarcobacter ebronensis]
MEKIQYDLIVIGSGAAGMIASIVAARSGKRVLLCEQQSKLGPKLKATGGGKCNLTNTLTNEDFMNSFGKNGRFMQDALEKFDYKSLIEFLNTIGVETHIPDGFRVFPVSHSSETIINALENEILKQNIEVKKETKIVDILCENEKILGVKSQIANYYSTCVIVATGGLGFSSLGANGDGYKFAKSLGHKITELYPAMLPLITKESWVSNCRADTIAKAQIRVDLKKAKKLKACGDLIFTSKGLRGPVILDFSREITPLLEEYKEVPLLINMIKGLNEEELFNHIKEYSLKHNDANIKEVLETLLPFSVLNELCKLVGADYNKRFKDLEGTIRQNLIKILVSTPLTIVDHIGFEKAMITRGGVSLKEINPKTMQSKIIEGLYFCGEVMDLDGPCGGYNLQWSFASGNLAGELLN